MFNKKNENESILDSLFSEASRLIIGEREHIGGVSKEVHTMNLLFCSFFNKTELTEYHNEIMNCLQALEMQTLIIDKAIDKPSEIKDWDIRCIIGFILFPSITESFMHAIRNLELDEKTQLKLINLWNNTFKHIYIGQGLDLIYGKKDLGLDLRNYLKIIEETTAKFIQLSLILGAIISGKNKEEIIKIENYGIHLGLRFQIRDDFIDFRNDINEGKQRIFVIKEILEKLSKEEREKILDNYRKNSELCFRILNKEEIKNYVIVVNNKELDTAISSLNGLNGVYINRLVNIANFLRIK